MKVLSLFDGISCGQIALERAGIEVDEYYASEIEKHAIKVTQSNYPRTKQLGNVINYKDWELPEIDLLIGGSPCQGFSTIGKGLNFEDPRSILLFKFVEVLKKTKPKYFLLENVMMKKENQDIISDLLGVEPIKINSSLVSAQNRERLYWTNMPVDECIEDKGIIIQDILQENIEEEFFIKNRKRSIDFVLRKYDDFYKKNGYTPKMFNPYNCREIFDKSPTLTAEGSRISVSSSVLIKEENGDIRSLTPLEWERLQNIPENYTSCVENNHRYNCLGNAWTVNIISHIFKGLK